MKKIFQQMGVFSVFFIGWYLFFMLVTLYHYPQAKTIDNSHVETKNIRRVDKLKRNIFLLDFQNILLGSWLTKHEGKQIIVIGGSNMLRIQGSVMQSILPDYAVNHAIIKGSNVTQLQEIVDVLNLSNPGSQKDTLYVIGMYYGTFADDKIKIGHTIYKNQNLTYIEAEALRYGLYKVQGHTISTTIPHACMPAAVFLLKPFLLWYDIFYDLKLFYDDFWISLNTKLGRQKQTPSAEELRKTSVSIEQDTWGPLKDFLVAPQIHDFIALCQSIHQSGGSILIVDLPIPPWTQARSDYYKKYIQKRQGILNELNKIPNLTYFDLGKNLGHLSDDDFVDSVHPTIEEGIVWARGIAGFIASQPEGLRR